MLTLRRPRSAAAAGVAAIAIAIAVALGAWAQRESRRGPESWTVEVVAAYPHDPTAFTQGLAIDAGTMYESTGQYGASSLRKVDFTTGRVEKLRALGPQYFAEGIAILGGRVYQLTWRNELAVIYDLATFNVLRTVPYRGEGWGLTHDGTHLIGSDGSATLKFIDPATFEIVRSVEVRDGDSPVVRLNELEFIDGEVWSNIWYDDRIARISPATGRVVGWIDLSSLYPRAARGSEAVLNGIAFDAAAKRLFVTGKYWPQLFEVEVVPAR